MVFFIHVSYKQTILTLCGSSLLKKFFLFVGKLSLCGLMWLMLFIIFQLQFGCSLILQLYLVSHLLALQFFSKCQKLLYPLSPEKLVCHVSLCGFPDSYSLISRKMFNANEILHLYQIYLVHNKPVRNVNSFLFSQLSRETSWNIWICFPSIAKGVITCYFGIEFFFVHLYKNLTQMS